MKFSYLSFNKFKLSLWTALSRLLAIIVVLTSYNNTVRLLLLGRRANASPASDGLDCYIYNTIADWD